MLKASVTREKICERITTTGDETNVLASKRCGRISAGKGRFVAVFPGTKMYPERRAAAWEVKNGELELALKWEYQNLCGAWERLRDEESTDAASRVEFRFKPEKREDPVFVGKYDIAECAVLARSKKLIEDAKLFADSMKKSAPRRLEPEVVAEVRRKLQLTKNRLQQLLETQIRPWISKEGNKLKTTAAETANLINKRQAATAQRAVDDYLKAFPTQTDTSVEYALLAIELGKGLPKRAWRIWKEVYDKECSKDAQPGCISIFNRLIQQDPMLGVCGIGSEQNPDSETAENCPESFRREAANKRITRYQERVKTAVDDYRRELARLTGRLSDSPTVEEFKRMKRFIGDTGRLKKILERCPQNSNRLSSLTASCEKLTQTGKKARRVIEDKLRVLMKRGWNRVSYADRAQMWEDCREQIRGRLKAPATAEFPDLADTEGFHNFLGDGPSYYIEGHVDAQNAFGAKLRKSIQCSFRKKAGKFELTGANFGS